MNAHKDISQNLDDIRNIQQIQDEKCLGDLMLPKSFVKDEDTEVIDLVGEQSDIMFIE